LPLCEHSKVLRKFDGGNSFDATLTVGLPFGPGLQETYVSCVQVYPDKFIVETNSIESKLFDSLKSRWKLAEVQPSNEKRTGSLPSCDVEFEVQMTVSDPMISQVLDKVLEQVAGRQVRAFEERCKEIPLPPDLQMKKQ
jgi:ribosome-associated toxin RatA of RatAB toxin-antitoxin module